MNIFLVKPKIAKTFIGLGVEIKNGTLKITKDDIEYAEEIYIEVHRLLEELQQLFIINFFSYFFSTFAFELIFIIKRVSPLRE